MGKRHYDGNRSLTTGESCSMRMTGIALVLFALAGVRGGELLNADFETLKSRLMGPGALWRTVSRTTQRLKRSRAAMLMKR